MGGAFRTPGSETGNRSAAQDVPLPNRGFNRLHRAPPRLGRATEAAGAGARRRPRAELAPLPGLPARAGRDAFPPHARRHRSAPARRVRAAAPAAERGTRCSASACENRPGGPQPRSPAAPPRPAAATPGTGTGSGTGSGTSSGTSKGTGTGNCAGTSAGTGAGSGACAAPPRCRPGAAPVPPRRKAPQSAAGSI